MSLTISPSLVHPSRRSLSPHRLIAGEDTDGILVHHLMTSTQSKISTADIGVATFAMSDDNETMCVVDLNGRANFLKMDPDFVSYSDEEGGGGIVSNKVIRSMSCKVGFAKCGGMPTFAVPSKDGVCELYTRVGDNKWSSNSALEGENSAATHFGKDLNLACFSPSGEFLATADVEGVIVVWKVDIAPDGNGTADSVNQFSPADKTELVDLVWSSKDSILACSKTGFAVMKDVIPVVVEAPVEAVAEVMEREEQPVPAVEKEFVAKEPTVADDVNDSQDGEMDLDGLEDNVDGAPKASEGTKEKPQRRLNKNSSANTEDSDDEGLFEDTPAAQTSGNTISGVTDSQQSEDAVTSKNVGKNQVFDDEDEAYRDHEEDRDIRDQRDSVAKNGMAIDGMNKRLRALETARKDAFKAIQEPFQPSSTVNDAKLRRYLVWNSVGYVRLDEDPSEAQNRIEINFTDRGGRNKGFSFPDKEGFRIGSLSNEGAFFATDIGEVDEEDANYKNPEGSKLFYNAFPGHLNGANESFYLELKESEKALCVAVGAGWAAVATSKGLLRVFSSTGVQLHVYWLKGPVVTLVGADSQLAVIYNSGQPVDGTSRINVELYSIYFDAPDQNRCVLADHTVPLSKKGSLVWAGFEKEHKTLIVVDSEGMMSMLVKPLGWQWMPVYDIHEHRKSPDMEFWPIMVSGGNFTYILLNGESHPAVWPKPAESTRELRVPIASSGSGRDFKVFDDHSHSYLYAQALVAHNEKNKNDCIVSGERNHDDLTDEAMDALQMQADKMVLIMLQTALKASQTAKAKDLSHKLRTDKGLAAGIQLANKYGKADVARLLEGIQDFRMEQQKLESVEEERDDYEGGRLQYEEADGGTPQQRGRAAQSYAAEDDGDQPHYDDDSYQPTNDGYANGNEVAEPSAAEPENEVNSQHRSQVTPSVVASNDGPVNPFAKNASPVKRKANFGIEGVVNDFKTSPSPAKKPLLSRQSSFSESARKSQKTRQALL